MALTQEAFEAHIDTMTQNTLTRGISNKKFTPFVLASEITTSAANEELPESVKSDFEASKTDLTSLTVQQKDDATSSVESYQKTNNQSSFDKEIDQQRNKNIESFTNQQNKLANKLKAAGAKHPGAQNAILAAYSVVSDFFSMIGNKIAEFFGNLVRKISAWVKKAVEKVGEFFSNVGSSIASAFSFL